MWLGCDEDALVCLVSFVEALPWNKMMLHGLVATPDGEVISKAMEEDGRVFRWGQEVAATRTCRRWQSSPVVLPVEAR